MFIAGRTASSNKHLSNVWKEWTEQELGHQSCFCTTVKCTILTVSIKYSNYSHDQKWEKTQVGVKGRELLKLHSLAMKPSSEYVRRMNTRSPKRFPFGRLFIQKVCTRNEHQWVAACGLKCAQSYERLILKHVIHKYALSLVVPDNQTAAVSAPPVHPHSNSSWNQCRCAWQQRANVNLRFVHSRRLRHGWRRLPDDARRLGARLRRLRAGSRRLGDRWRRLQAGSQRLGARWRRLRTCSQRLGGDSQQLDVGVVVCRERDGGRRARGEPHPRSAMQTRVQGHEGLRVAVPDGHQEALCLRRVDHTIPVVRLLVDELYRLELLQLSFRQLIESDCRRPIS